MSIKRKIFTATLLCTMMVSNISANAIELKINADAGGEIRGNVLLGENMPYVPVTISASNEDKRIIYLEQVYTDESGNADFTYFHNKENAGSGKMTVNAVYNGEIASDTYNVPEPTLNITCSPAEKLEEKRYKMDYTAKNAKNENCEFWVITASYAEGGKLVGVDLKEKSLKPGEAISETISFAAENNEAIKTYFLEKNLFKPYCRAVKWETYKPEKPSVIRVESESGTAEGFKPQYLTGTGVSDKLLHLYRTTFNSDAVYSVDYTFNCDAAGVYDIQGVFSEFSGYSADCFVSVNGRPAVHSSRAGKLEDVTIGVDGLSEDLLDKYSFGIVDLIKGTNTLSLQIENKNWENTGVSFDTDYFEFIPVTNAAETAKIVSADGRLNIFEKKEDVLFDILLDGIADNEKTIQYTVTDYFNNECRSSSAVIPMGKARGSIQISGLDTGWYRLNVSGDIINRELDFAVVPDYDSRNIDDSSPFAMDLASSWHTDSHYEQRMYANAAKLAGSTWARDRFLWRETEPSQGVYKYNHVIGDTAPLKDTGLRVSNVFHDAPTWAKENGGTLPKNPKIMYNFIKNAADGLSNNIDLWEIWNEQDAYMFSKEGADKYAAMLKAAAVAAGSSNSKPLIALGGLCSGDSEYNNTMLQSGVMDYIDIYNYHTHLDYDISTGIMPEPMAERMKTYEALAQRYGIGDKPIWQTESGIRQKTVSPDVQLTDEQCRAQAQHIIPAYLEAAAAGVDKQFSFIGLPFAESGADFGLFNNRMMPRPAYAVQAVMTKLLEGMSFYGTVNGLPSGAKGYAMHKGSSITEVLWSSNKCRAEIPASDSVKAYNIMGSEVQLNADNGKAAVTLSENPIYIVYDKAGAPDNITVNPKKIDLPKKTILRDSQKIVLFAQFPAENLENDKSRGYSLSCSGNNEVKVTVYNFSDKEMTGTLNADSENGMFNAECGTAPITIPAQSSAVAVVNVSANSLTKPCEIYNLRISGVFNNEDISPAVANVCFDRGITNTVVLNGSNEITGDGWQSPSVTDNIKYTMTKTSDGVQFNVTGDGKNGQFYPFVYTRSQNLKDYKGITLKVYFDKTVKKDEYNYMTIQISDAIPNNFTLESSLNIPIKEGWSEYSFKWPDFTHRVVGQAPSITDVLGKYCYVKIGIHTSQKAVNYKLSDVGLFR
ncbi:MAG: hypothetical protein J6N52_09485 [Clostridia bacterium]|nr:hypothetical protein [Clostridia bacterium]